LVIAAGFVLHFPRSRHHRAVASTALGGDQYSRGSTPDGAGTELAGLLAVLLIAMALLVFGYRSHGVSAVTEATSGPNNQLATDRAHPTTLKPYQPQNPRPDMRSAPTGSSTGTGPDSGGPS